LIPLTQDVLAELAGTSRATVNRVLNEEQRRGTLELRRGRTLIRERGALERRAR
jgi:CRP-like cAMP-binding protein